MTSIGLGLVALAAVLLGVAFTKAVYARDQSLLAFNEERFATWARGEIGRQVDDLNAK